MLPNKQYFNVKNQTSSDLGNSLSMYFSISLMLVQLQKEMALMN